MYFKFNCTEIIAFFISITKTTAFVSPFSLSRLFGKIRQFTPWRVKKFPPVCTKIVEFREMKEGVLEKVTSKEIIG